MLPLFEHLQSKCYFMCAAARNASIQHMQKKDFHAQ